MAKDLEQKKRILESKPRSLKNPNGDGKEKAKKIKKKEKKGKK